MITTKTYYMVVDTTTGKWMIQSKKRGKTSLDLSHTLPPRLFEKKFAATQAMNWWCEGIWFMTFRPSTWEQPEDYALNVAKRFDRHKDNMKVVQANLTFEF